MIVVDSYGSLYFLILDVTITKQVLAFLRPGLILFVGCSCDVNLCLAAI